jgi:predicted dienelactone hydrolase
MIRGRSILETAIGAGLALWLVACPAPEPTPEDPPEILAAGPDRVLNPEASGPYPAGVRTVWIEDRSRRDPAGGDGPRRFRVEIWYPAVDEARDAEPDVIRAMDEIPEAFLEDFEGIELPALVQPAVRDAPIRTDQGRFPVVLFSHGQGGIRYQSFTYTAHLATHGYVVVSPDHVGNTLFEMVTGTSLEGSSVLSTSDRPMDLSLILDRLEDHEVTDGWLEPHLDFNRVGVTGHSFGGFVSLLITHPSADLHDPRFTVSVPITPASEILLLFGAGDLSRIEAPTFYVGATADRTLDYETETVAAYEAHLPPRGMVGVLEAGHFSFTEVCDLALADAAAELGMESSVQSLLRDGCGEENIPVTRAYALLNRYATAWLNVHLRGSEETARYLDPAGAPADADLRVDLEAP